MNALRYLLEHVEPRQWAEGVGKRLLPILRDKNGTADPDERLAAVEIAGDYTQINDSVAATMLAIVENPAEPEELRAKAAGCFGAALEAAYLDDFEDPEMVPISEKMFLRIQSVLRQVFQDASVPKLVRRRIMEGSIRAPEEWHTEEIRKAYASGDAEWKLTAVFCMNYVRGFEKEVLESLKSKDPEVHLEAVRAAGSFEIGAAWPHIAELAQSEVAEKGLRIAAIEALSTLKPQDSLNILHTLSDHEDEDIAEAADEARSMAVDFLDTGEDDDDFDDDEFDDDDEDDEKPKFVN